MVLTRTAPANGEKEMSESVIIIDTSEVREGKLGDLRKALSGLAAFVEANEPRVIAYTMYLNQNGTRLTVMQVHPDSESAAYHMKLAASAFSGFVDLIRMNRIDVYGDPGHELLEMLQRKARMLGTGDVEVHDLQAGFVRSGDLNLK